MPQKEDIPEFRKDLVSGDWILVAAGRRKRPQAFKEPEVVKVKTGTENCVFEDPQKNGNPVPLLWYPRPNMPSSKIEDFSSWFLQVIPNKFPLLIQKKDCPLVERKGSQETLLAVGYHEVIVTRDHDKTLSEMSLDEIKLVLKAYKERYRALAEDPCVKYILIFHNQGETAGASVAHPHSQLVALPIIDPDVASSLNGSLNYHKIYKKCVHCVMIEQEIKEKVRVIHKDEHFIAVAPFASRVSYEIRIYPLKHAWRFEDLDKDLFPSLAETLKTSLLKLNKALGRPDYNFFIHTAPVRDGDSDHYHWHLEILPSGFKWAGLELGMGIEVVAVSPEEAAKDLRRQKI